MRETRPILPISGAQFLFADGAVKQYVFRMSSEHIALGPNAVLALFNDSDQGDAASSELKAQGFTHQELGSSGEESERGDTETAGLDYIPAAGAMMRGAEGFVTPSFFTYPVGLNALGLLRFGDVRVDHSTLHGKVPLVVDAGERKAEAIAIIERNGGKIQHP